MKYHEAWLLWNCSEKENTKQMNKTKCNGYYLYYSFNLKDSKNYKDTYWHYAFKWNSIYGTILFLKKEIHTHKHKHIMLTAVTKGPKKCHYLIKTQVYFLHRDSPGWIKPDKYAILLHSDFQGLRLIMALLFQHVTFRVISFPAEV